MANGQIKAPCSCQHEYQDKRYGKGMRLHTLTNKGNKRCTVCGKETRL